MCVCGGGGVYYKCVCVCVCVCVCAHPSCASAGLSKLTREQVLLLLHSL